MIATRAEVKAFLQIPALNTAYDSLIDSLLRPVQEWLFSYCHNWFEVGVDTVYIQATTISFVNGSPATIVDSDENFLNAGFADGMHIRVKGSLFNNGVFKVATVTDSTITLDSLESLINEDLAQYVKITVVRFDEGIKLPYKSLIGEEIKSNLMDADGNVLESITSESVGNTSFTFSGMKGSYPDELLKMLAPYRRPVKV